MSSPSVARRFQIALIKPSHYDDDGYVIQWWRTFIPSTSLAAVYGLVEDARLRKVLGDDVAIDGFHVSGCLAMLDGIPSDLQEALDLGITLYAGELEGPCDTLLRDAATGRLKPIYDYLKDLPGLEATPPPILPKRFLKGTYNLTTSFDAGRGCPFECSFCTIINVQGRKSRRRTPDDVEKLIRA